MKNLIAIPSLFLGMVLSLSLSGQDRQPIQIGLHGGGYLNDAAIRGLNLNTGEYLNPESTFGYSFGAHAIVPLGSGFSFMPEVNYSERGAALSEGIDLNIFEIDVPLGAEVQSRINYIDVPLKARYDFGGNGISGFVNAGPMVSYATRGRIETRLNTFFDIPIHTFELNMDGRMANRFEVSAVVGAGVSIPAGQGSLFLEGQYIHGLTDVFETPIIDVGLRQKSYGIRIGYSIPIGKTSKTRIDKV